MTLYSDGWWQSADGLRLHYRDYPGHDTGNSPDHGAGLPPIVCLPGLTRNARDFAKLAEWLSSDAGGGWRVLCPEMRGRGLSAYAENWQSYHPYQYNDDVLRLLDGLGIAQFVAIGTSLGGLMTMLIAARTPERLAGALLNDIGPELVPEGLVRIATYVGRDVRYPGWAAAVAAQRAEFGAAFPGRSDESWLTNARRLMVEDADGTVRFDYDVRIAEPFRQGVTGPMPDLWPAYEALRATAECPVLVLRGGLSDLLSEAAFARMGERLPGARLATVAGVGHAPALDEPEAVAAITDWLAAIREHRA